MPMFDALKFQNKFGIIDDPNSLIKIDNKPRIKDMCHYCCQKMQNTSTVFAKEPIIVIVIVRQTIGKNTNINSFANKFYYSNCFEL